jgi:hypothetical protein
MFSGGIGSWGAARRVVDKHGTEGLVLLFTDTLIEDADLYRFLDDAAADIGVPVTRIADGRTPWQVFHDERYLGNTRADPCSRILKRGMIDRWLAEHYEPDNVIVYVGIDWTEMHRYDRLRERRLPWRYEAPLCDPPLVTKHDLLATCRARGLTPPRLYALGAPHNNCGGGCVKAGQGHFAWLLRVLPEVFEEWESNEESLRAELGNRASILRDRTGGTTDPLTLRELRERIESGQQPDLFDIGGCGCFVDGAA